MMGRHQRKAGADLPNEKRPHGACTRDQHLNAAGRNIGYEGIMMCKRTRQCNRPAQHAEIPCPGRCGADCSIEHRTPCVAVHWPMPFRVASPSCECILCRFIRECMGPTGLLRSHQISARTNCLGPFSPDSPVLYKRNARPPAHMHARVFVCRSCLYACLHVCLYTCLYARLYVYISTHAIRIHLHASYAHTSVRMPIHMSACTSIHMPTPMCVKTSIKMSIHMSKLMHMSVQTCLYACVYACLCNPAHTHAYTHACTHVYTHVHTHAYILCPYACLYACAYVWSICMPIRMPIRMHLYTCLFACVYTHAHVYVHVPMHGSVRMPIHMPICMPICMPIHV